jgi:hypothetical protein
VKARRVKKLDPAAPLCANAARIVRVRLDELRSFAPEALDPSASEVQHDMRIAAKRLRYVLELTQLCFGERGTVARRAARDLQGVLGEIHDCDVMLSMAEGQLKRLRELDAGAVRARGGDATELDPALAAAAPHLASYRGLEILAVHLAARRRLLFDRFLDLWAQQRRSGVWEDLDSTTREGRRAVLP